MASSLLAGLVNLTVPAEILIYIGDEQNRRHLTVKNYKDRFETLPLYFDGENVSGKVVIRVKDGKKVEFLGLAIELFGLIEFYYDKNNPSSFLSLKEELVSQATVLTHTNSYDFSFQNVEKLYESYSGMNVRLRYFLRATLFRKMGNMVKEKDLWVHSYRVPPDINTPIKMEVGIEDCLHIEFEYDKNKYHLFDVIVGKIYFILVRIKVRHMELSIIRRETTGIPPNQYNENETLTRFEIMDGAPGKAESIPIRLFLNGFDVGPTFREVNQRFSVRYYLNLVLVDEENRRYFKQQEVTIFREKDSVAGSLNDRVENSKLLRTVNVS